MSNTLIAELTTPETAAELGITVSFVNSLIARGKLKARKQGRDWFVDAKSVAERKTAMQANPERKRGGRPKTIN